MDRLKLWANEQFKKLTGYNSTLLEVVEDPTYRGHIVRSCDEQLQKTRELIDDPAFSDRVGTLIDKAKEKLKKDGIIYYTGCTSSSLAKRPLRAFTNSWKICSVLRH